jgi:L,D-transpeptidase catalytic domain
VKDQVLRAADEPERSGDSSATDGMTSSQAPRSPSQRDQGRSRSAGKDRAHGKSSAPPPKPAGSGAATIVGFAAAAVIGGAVAWSSGCRNEPPPGLSTDLPPHPSTLPAPPAPPPRPSAVASASAPASASAAPVASAAPAEKPYTGPLLGALALQTAVYPKPEHAKKILGYIRLGGKVPVDPTPIKDPGGKCSAGWYHLVDGGYVCGKYGTIDINNPQVRLGITPPALEDVLPYKYAFNTAHGTPLYRSVPSKEEMLKYEPYLEAAKRAKKKADREKEKEEDGTGGAPAEDAKPAETADGDGTKADAIAKAEAVGILEDAGAPPPADDKPWWQQASDKNKPLKVKLADLESDSDATIAKRMVKGFFVAVDKTFGWNGRSWYKTTGGLVAPADRMVIVKPPATQGIDFPEGVKQVGFITATKASKYEFDADQKKVTVLGPAPRFTGVGLTGATVSNKTIIYRQTTEGWWMKAIDGTFTEPGDKPADLAPGEKWIDVNLTRKTLVAFEGDKPVFAALVSPGKKSSNKEKDHSTIQGTFRIREKHIAVTMDGDGKAASDLPYSIEDVPYVQYFEGSYALHGAFWHNNFGHEMSHGCVNLSPLDAKKVFFWSEPRLPRGWHAVWATPENHGTIVVVHE